MRYRITTQKEKYSSEQTITLETSQRTAIEKYLILAEKNYFCLLEMVPAMYGNVSISGSMIKMAIGILMRKYGTFYRIDRQNFFEKSFIFLMEF